ncbi:3'-5' exonuclease [Thiomicrorhabdus lithotrophica]|uniref:3'-5' exoribonuclease n=1 Tax=Thiomicrorhabdus lithotrophica TaxID=2949997 RepID=A0ABY8C878_9GAMM|nr:3'-5' exonuclease [Thiomicrorhabdus lithotrophica]WEJ62168.1 3'-5' exoribonuclease [Thiomicrorhabdus lithotrophica]
MATHVMIDIETLGTGVDSVIASIGAVQFNPKTGHVAKNGFEALLSVEDGCKLGFKMDCDTVAWWQGQSDEARKQLDGDVLVRSAILQFMAWLNGLCDKDDLRVWGNGPTFDLALLIYHFDRMDYELPWGFRGERCVRTLVELGRANDIDPKKTIEFVGVKHSALDDAKHQAKYVSAIWQALGLVDKVEAA